MKLTRIGDFLKRSKIPVDILDKETYKRVTIRINHNGVSLRDLEVGKQIGTKKQFILKAGQFIMSKIDARYGAFGIAPDEVDGAIITGNFWAYDVDFAKLNLEWFNQYTNSPDFYDLCERASTGITHRKYLNETFFLNYEIPLPSIEEQLLQIVKIQGQKETFSKLNNELTSQLNLIKQLRQVFLREAMQGKLVKSTDVTETGQQLLEKIKAEKTKLIAEKKIKKEKELQPIATDEIPFEIPEHWAWCRLGDVCTKITDGEHVTPKKISEGRMLLSAKNIREGFISYENVDFISEEDYQKSIQRCKPEKNDILLVSVGGTIGRSTIKMDDADFAIVRSVALIKPFYAQLSKYFKYVLDSPILQREISGRSWGTAQPCLYINQIKELLIPMPSLSEQQQIVAKLSELMAYCDSLEQSTKESQKYNELLLQQVLREALQPKEKVTDNIEELVDEEDYQMHLAMLHKLIKQELGINYGEVATQKTVFHINSFTKEKIPYPFINSNYGTYSYQLRDDLQKNKYLSKAKVQGKDVFKVNPIADKEVEQQLLKPQNKNFVQSVKEVLSIYKLPFINKETDKIELLNTVSKTIMDLQSIDADVVYQGLKDWKINQGIYKCKAEKFSKDDVVKMIGLITAEGLVDNLL